MSPSIDRTIRKAYYGAGRQPWDDIVAAGFGPAFAASSILKYLRRDKGTPVEDLEKARWYFARLEELALQAAEAKLWLKAVLTVEELGKLEVVAGMGNGGQDGL